MTKREAAIVTAYTGFLIGDVDDFYKYIKEIFGRPVFTHELRGKDFWDEIQKRSMEDFKSIVVE